MLHPINTEINNCRDCYKCVRSCPVKAIQIKDAHALIVPDRCTWCGACVDACPNKVKYVRNDIDFVARAIKSGDKVYASIAPSYVSEYAGYEDDLIRALYKLGFTAVSETAIGATLVSEALDLYYEEHENVSMISTACPAVVELVKKYYPKKAKYLAPVPSPAQTHSAYLKNLYGEDIVVVFIGPCIAKKYEASLTPGYPDYALTFNELDQWMMESNIQLETIDKSIQPKLVPAKAGKASIYPIENGQIETSRLWNNKFINCNAISVSGYPQLESSFSGDLEGFFLESLSCNGGCINGPATKRNASTILRKRSIADYTLSHLDDADLFEGDADFAKRLLDEGYGILNAEAPTPEPVIYKGYPESEIQKALRKLGKQTKEDEMNCSGCGYHTCRDMAVALLDGLSEPEMCVTKMRKDAESKVDILLSTIPNGAVIIDNDLNIVECNKGFIKIFEDYPDNFLDAEGLRSFHGMPVSNFVPWVDKFQEQFYLKKPSQYRFKHNGLVYRVTFFLVEGKRLLGAIFEDVTTPTVRREAVVAKAEDVISKSLTTVQQIASLLGENAAETEIVLNSIIEEFNVQTESTGDYGLIEEN